MPFTPHSHPGRLIALEGLDGSGKSTQLRRIQDSLEKNGYTVTASMEPSQGPVGQRIRELAREGLDELTGLDILNLFLEDRTDHSHNLVLPALKAGHIVLLDRYYYSSMAYQGAKGVDLDYIIAQHENRVPPADLALYFRIPSSLARERIEKGRGEGDLFEKAAFLKKVQAIFDSLEFPEWTALDGTASPDEVFEQAWSAILPILPKPTH